MTALVINCIIGSGIFGVPSEPIRLLGQASPLVMVLAGLAQGIIMASIIEVSSQFSGLGFSTRSSCAAERPESALAPAKLVDI
jgi:amino acid transporter